MSDDPLGLAKKYAAATNTCIRIIVVPTGEVGVQEWFAWNEATLDGYSTSETLEEAIRRMCERMRASVYAERDRQQQALIASVELLENLPL